MFFPAFEKQHVSDVSVKGFDTKNQNSILRGNHGFN